MATDGLEFSDIYLLVRGALNDGRLKLHKGGIIFKANKTGKIDQAAVADIESTSWLRVARGFELNVALTNGMQFKFEGFKEADYDQLATFIKENFGKDLEEIELSVKGWNWGTAKFKGSSLCFEVDEKPAFIVPLKDVSQATTGKNEVALEFHQNDDAQICLMEMRFYIPTPADNPTEDPVKSFHQKVLEKADIIQAIGDAIVTIPDIACLTPRGRYTMKVFPSFLQLHGKTYDYKIPYTSVLRLFLLPHKDQRFMFFVVSMDPPIKQGQTRYPFLIIQFEKDEEFDVKLNLSEEELKEKYEGKITQEMDGPIYEIVSRLMKAVVGRRITVPGTFKSHAGVSCITCSYRAGSGMLYPLERGFIFVHKPPVHIRFDEISSVNFARVAGGGGSSRSFDFEVETKSGVSYVFSSIEKEEYGKLFDFVSGKHLRIKNTGKVSSKQYEDELMPGSDEDSHDAYLEQMKAEGAEKYEESESSEDESDESFNPGSGGEDQDLKEENCFNLDFVLQTDETPQGKRKKKAKKDADAPKRPMSGYMLWLSEIREQIKGENPGISVTELSKVAGEKWKKIEDKTKWQEMAKEAKKKYDEAMKVYKEKKANEPNDSPDEKPSKKGSVKEFFNKKGDKKKTASPRKAGSGESQKFKSAEFVETDDSSSEDEDKKTKPKPKPKAKAKPKPGKSKSKSKKESEEEESEEEEEESEDVDMSDGSDSD
ncbi:FACT complex subunit SSRP1-like [Pocillopora damicornis]|uniref:FACT complex subunit SSRP1-like n=1 Tax=Pocillopora damicornis TaxID=46731 RepID=UPI000F54E94D|nr:FACT complex subunit SSRP1-like [Pocillopora damicornis]